MTTMRTMRLKLISDGTGGGTRLVDAATGAIVENAVRVTWALDAREGIARATVTVLLLDAEITADATVEDVPITAWATKQAEQEGGR